MNTTSPTQRRGAWLVYAVTTVGLFGVWQTLPKLPALAREQPLAVQFAALPGLLIALVLTGAPKRLQHASRRGLSWAALTGAAGACGTWAILQAFSLGGPGSVVTPLCGMYPLVTALGARFIFGERLGLVQKAGLLLFGLAVLAFGAQESFHGSGPLRNWLPYVALALFIFGASGLSMKLATRTIVAPAALAGWCVGFVFVTVGTWAIASRELPGGTAFWLMGTSYGLLMGLGLWTSFEAYRQGKAAVVTAITALYPAVTAGLSISIPSIGESISALKLASIALSLIAGAALAIEPAVAVDT